MTPKELTYLRLECLKLAHKIGCKNHKENLKIAKENLRFVLKAKTKKMNTNSKNHYVCSMALIKCSECGKEISDKAKVCINCGAPIEISIQPKETPEPASKQETPSPQPKSSDLNQHKGTETNYYSRDGVRITNTRFIVENTTYPLTGITSVRTSEIVPNKTGPIFLIILGAILGLLGLNSNSNIATFGVVFIATGIIWLMLLKTWYALRISTAAGETDAVTSKDEDYIRKITMALNEAIIHRG